MTEMEETRQSQIVPMPSLKAAMEEADIALPPSSLLTKLLLEEQSDAAIDWPERWDAQETLSCLTTPPYIAVSSFSLDHATYQFLFPWTDEDGLCLYSHAGDDGHLVAPVHAAGIASLLAEDFDPVTAPPPIELQFEFDRQSFLAFAAISDFCRYVYTVSMMERIAVPLHQFSLTQLSEQIYLNEDKPDYRWLLSYWPHFYADDGSPNKADIAAGCKLLAEQELIIGSEDGDDVYVLSRRMLALVAQFIMLSNAALVETSAGCKTAFFNAATLWHAKFSENSVILQSVDGLELITSIHDIMTNATPKPALGDAEGDVDTSNKFCGQCGGQMPLNQNFCKKCGTENQH